MQGRTQTIVLRMFVWGAIFSVATLVLDSKSSDSPSALAIAGGFAIGCVVGALFHKRIQNEYSMLRWDLRTFLQKRCDSGHRL
jgi:hypothetical protein